MEKNNKESSILINRVNALAFINELDDQLIKSIVLLKSIECLREKIKDNENDNSRIYEYSNFLIEQYL